MNEGNSGLKKQKTRKKKRFWKSFFLYMLFFIIIFVVCGFVSYSYISNQDNTDSLEVLKSIDPENSVEVVIPYGSNTDKILEILMEKKLVKNPLLFKLISKINGYEYLYKSGKHILSPELSYEEMMKVLCSAPVTVTVTIPEGKNFNEIVKILEDKKLITRDDFINAAENESFGYKFLESIPKRKNRLEGYLFPDTYFFDPSSNPKDVIAKFLNNFDNKFKVEYYKRAEELGMTVDQIIILASIIEKEAARSEEMPIVSSVFHNRLKSNDPALKKLQSCATVQFILLNKEGKIKEKLTEADTRIEDPYNTYLHEGLPPGPICCPGLEAILAALYPAEDSKYYYFVARGDGTNHFSTTLKEHEEAKKKYGVN